MTLGTEALEDGSIGFRVLGLARDDRRPVLTSPIVVELELAERTFRDPIQVARCRRCTRPPGDNCYSELGCGLYAWADFLGLVHYAAPPVVAIVSPRGRTRPVADPVIVANALTGRQQVKAWFRAWRAAEVEVLVLFVDGSVADGDLEALAARYGVTVDPYTSATGPRARAIDLIDAIGRRGVATDQSLAIRDRLEALLDAYGDLPPNLTWGIPSFVLDTAPPTIGRALVPEDLRHVAQRIVNAAGATSRR